MTTYSNGSAGDNFGDVVYKYDLRMGSFAPGNFDPGPGVDCSSFT